MLAEKLTPIDRVSVVAIASQIQAMTGTSTIASLAAKYSVPLMSEHRNRAELIDRLQPKSQQASSPDLASLQNELRTAKAVIGMLLGKSQGVSGNNVRKSYAPWLKQYLAGLLESGAGYQTITKLTAISEETLRHFRADHLTTVVKEPASDDHQFIKEAWNKAPARCRKTLDSFWTYLGHCHSHYKISLEQVRTILAELGLRYPRGKQSKNAGTTVKTEFTPKALWEGDGKQLNITVNGSRHTFCWYAFCDQHTTLLVGSSVTGAESSEAFLSALKSGHQQQGAFAIGVLIDNRLGESDLSMVRSFCIEHRIVLARIFPGNSKSNGHIENNFSIFERFVGDVHVSGKNDKEIAESIANVIVEVFTQQRNHTPRKRLGSRSPADYPTPDRPPEHVRSAVERLANRFNREIRDIEAKWDLIKPAREHFEQQPEASQQKLMKQLGKYPSGDILFAQTQYLAQIFKYPDQTYRSEYFMAILRHKREEEAKRVFNEAWRAGAARIRELMPPPKPIPPKDRAKDILEVFVEILDMATPAEWMVELDALAWWLIHYSRQASLPELWTAVEHEVVTSKVMSLKQWGEIKDYLSRLLGDFLYEPIAPTVEKQNVGEKRRADSSPLQKNLDRKGAVKDSKKSNSHRQSPIDARD